MPRPRFIRWRESPSRRRPGPGPHLGGDLAQQCRLGLGQHDVVPGGGGLDVFGQHVEPAAASSRRHSRHRRPRTVPSSPLPASPTLVAISPISRRLRLNCPASRAGASAASPPRAAAQAARCSVGVGLRTSMVREASAEAIAAGPGSRKTRPPVRIANRTACCSALSVPEPFSLAVGVDVEGKGQQQVSRPQSRASDSSSPAWVGSARPRVGTRGARAPVQAVAAT